MPLRPQVLYPAHAKQHPAVTGGNVAILSAENPRYPAQAQGTDALKAKLDALGLDYELTNGKYGAPEKSVIIQNPDLAIALAIGREFGQESIAWSENGRHQLHFVNGPQAGMATVPSEIHEWHDDEPQDNYTAVPGPHGEPWGYFTWNIDFNSPLVPSQQQLQPRAPAPQTQAAIPMPAQGAPSAPVSAPSASAPSPMAKSLTDDVRAWMERLGELRTRELAKAELPMAKSAAPVTPTDAYFHPSEGKAKKPAPAGPPAQNTYRNTPLDYAKSEYDAGSAVSMASGDMSHQQSSHGGVKKSEETHMKPESTKVDPLDADAGKHACKGCGAPFSPVVAALRKAKGSMCLKCEGSCGMSKGELKYENNEPQHGAADNAWKPKCKVVAAPGSGGKVTRNPVGDASNPGPASGGQTLTKTAFPMEAHAPQGTTVVPTSTMHPTQHLPLKSGAAQPLPAPVGPRSKLLGVIQAGARDRALGKTETPGQGEHGGSPKRPDFPAPVKKAESMSTPKAPGAGAATGSMPPGGGSSPPKMMPLGRSEASSALHKSISETVSLRKALRKTMGAPATALGGARQASFEAAGMPTGIPAAGKVQPKSPAEYDAAAFRPASPGAAGAPSGLELAKPKFGAGIPANRTILGGGTKPTPTLKQGLPIAKLGRVTGAPLSKPRA